MNEAVRLLEDLPNGEAIFRPHPRTTDLICLTIKVLLLAVGKCWLVEDCSSYLSYTSMLQRLISTFSLYATCLYLYHRWHLGAEYLPCNPILSLNLLAYGTLCTSGYHCDAHYSTTISVV